MIKTTFRAACLGFVLGCLTATAAVPEKMLFPTGKEVEWQHPDGVSIGRDELTIPNTVAGSVVSPSFPLPETRQALLLSFDFTVPPKFTPFEFLRVNLVWRDKDGREIGRHHQHPWFTFPTSALYGQKLPFHRLIEAASIPAVATVAQLCIDFKPSVRAHDPGLIKIDHLSVKAMYRLRGDTFANWFEKGKPIKFSGVPPEDALTIRGEVFNQEKQKVAGVTVNREKFLRDGWICPLTTPGFYTVKFFYDTATAKNLPWEEEYYAQRIKGVEFFEEQRYIRDYQHLVVTATAPRAPAEIPPQFGNSAIHPYKAALPYVLGVSQQDNFDAAKAVGSHFIRCFMCWDKIEKKPGQYDWAETDKFFAEAARNGYDQSRIQIGILDTPRFYTSQAENAQGSAYSDRYQLSPPNDLKAWERFIAAAVRHYPGVALWEIWNEPHLPGYSIFWKSTPEVYVKMLEAGYKTIKSVDPSKQVALGGIGQRYLPFYDRILALGAAPYFDILPFHGTDVNTDEFKAVDRKYGVTTKTMIANEWHPYILESARADLPSEELQAFNRIIDLLNMLRSGIRNIAVYGGFNSCWHGGNEREMIPLRKKDGAQLSGVFRTYPNQEPRYIALALRTLIDRFDGNIVFHQAYYFGKGEIKCAWLSSKRGNVIVFWTMEDKGVRLPELLASAFKKAVLLDEQGRRLSFSDRFMLAPRQVYYAVDPNVGLLADYKNVLRVLEPYVPNKELEEKFQSYYRAGRLFDRDWNLVDADSMPWTKASDYYAYMNTPEPKDFSARFALGMTPEKLDLCVVVNDRVHHDSFDSVRKIAPWDVDSVQFALDCSGKGLPGAVTEVVAAKDYLAKTACAAVGGDLPDKYTTANRKIKYGQFKVERQGATTTYKISIDASELYPFIFRNSPPLRFSLLVNNNNGNGREGYRCWAGGIGDMKEAAKFGTLSVQTSGRIIGTIADLKSSFQKGRVSRNPDGSVKVEAVGIKANEQIGSGTSGIINVQSGVKYQISFEARGTGKKLESFVCGPNFPRTNVGICMLDGQWHQVINTVIIPPGTEKMVIYIFTWGQPDSSFEVRNLTVKEAQVINQL